MVFVQSLSSMMCTSRGCKLSCYPSSSKRRYHVGIKRVVFFLLVLCLMVEFQFVRSFQSSPFRERTNFSAPHDSVSPTFVMRESSLKLLAMKRPILDQLATALFKLETKRVEDSSVMDEKGRMGEPMEWSESNSLANQFSQIMAQGLGYQLKQLVANIVAGDYDEDDTQQYIDDVIGSNKVVMFSFTTCPFCRRAKDLLDEQNITYKVIELDLLPDNRGNEIRASLGKITKRTSVPNIFIQQTSIGGLNDGTPGLLPLMESGKLLSTITEGA